MASRSPLTSIAGRTALIIGVTAGTVGRKELEAAALLDNQPRRFRVPVVAEGKNFKSVTDAAEYLYKKKPAYWRTSKAGKAGDMPRIMDNLKHFISRRCNADNIEGYYWAE